MENEIIVGLDIGTTKIACIVGRKNEFGKIEIMGYGKSDSHGVRRGVVTNIEDTVTAIKEAVKQASEQSGVEINNVNVGIAGQHIKSMQHRSTQIRENAEEEITKEEIDNFRKNIYKLSMTPGDKIIDVIPQDYIIDNEPDIQQPVGMLGSTLSANFHIIIAQTTAAKNIYKCVKKAGLDISQLILEPIASSQAVLSDIEKEAGVALVDIGGGTTDIAIFHEHILRWTAVIPFGGDIISEDIKEGCTIIKRHAEEIKVKFGSALASKSRDDEVVAIPGLRGRPPKEISFKMLSSIIQARVEEIIEHVLYEIKNSGYGNKLIAGIVLTGGGSLLKDIDKLVAFHTGLDTRIGTPNEHLSPESPKEMASPIYSTGIGLVIEGIKRNLLALKNNEIVDSAPQINKGKRKGNATPVSSKWDIGIGLKGLTDYLKKWWFESEN